MRISILLLLFCFGVSLLPAQTDLVGEFTFDGAIRSYRLHLPPGHDVDTEIPIILNLHGYTSFAAEQEVYSRMNEVADTANFAVCYPDGLNREWNVGWLFNRNTDDVGFLLALVDTLVLNYGFDESRIYACGMSNGGFMSYTLACEASDVFAAVGSVTGGMVPGRKRLCDTTSTALPVLQIHGTSDPTVAFRGSLINDPIDTTVAYWARRHNIVADPAISQVPDRANDGLTTTNYRYTSPGSDVAEVEYFVVQNGLHTWPGGAGNQAGQTQDFSASEELWRFFKQFSKQGIVNSQSVGFRQNKLVVYPNPVNDLLFIEATPILREIVLYAVDGREISRDQLLAGETQIDVSALNPGTYNVSIRSAAGVETATIVVR